MWPIQIGCRSQITRWLRRRQKDQLRTELNVYEGPVSHCGKSGNGQPDQSDSNSSERRRNSQACGGADRQGKKVWLPFQRQTTVTLLLFVHCSLEFRSGSEFGNFLSGNFD